MTNLSSLPGFTVGGGGGGGGSNPLLTDEMVEIDSHTEYITGSSNDSQQSSGSYQSFHQLSSDGCFGGIFDPYLQNAGGVYAAGFYINPSNGSIGSLSRSQIYSHSLGATFSTCHHSAIGMMVANHGHHYSPNYGGTRHGTCYGAKFNANGSPTNTAHGNPQPNAWPHSNGGLVGGASSATSDFYARRSTYNNSTGTYWHYNMRYNGTSSFSSDEYSNISSSTSTNYAWACAKQSKDDLQPGGMIAYYNSSGLQKFSCIYGQLASRGSESSLGAKYWTSQSPAFHLSNGQYLFYASDKCLIGSSSGSLSELNYKPDGINILNMINQTGRNQSFCVPTKDDDCWIVPFSSNLGLAKIYIDVNNNYKVTIQKIFSTLMTFGSTSVPTSGGCLSLCGSNDEYFVFTQVQNGQAEIRTFENPFLN